MGNKESKDIKDVLDQKELIDNSEDVIFVDLENEKSNNEKVNTKKPCEPINEDSAFSVLKKYYWLYENDKISEVEYMSLKSELLAELNIALKGSKDFTDYETDKFHCDLMVEIMNMLDKSLITQKEFEYLKGDK